MNEPVIIGNCTMYQGDCREILPTLGKVDAVVTDPLYDSEAHTPCRRTRAVFEGRQKKAGMSFHALTESMRAFLVEHSKKLANGWAIIFCQAEAVGTYRALFGKCWRRAMVWIKPDSAPQFNGDRAAMGYESICSAWCGTGNSKWNGGGKRGVFTYNCTGWRKSHETEKSLPLMIELVSLFTNENETICDPFMGSGTTGVACIRTGRKFIGIEIDPTYFKVACDRIQREWDAKQGTGPLIKATLLEAAQ